MSFLSPTVVQVLRLILLPVHFAHTGADSYDRLPMLVVRFVMEHFPHVHERTRRRTLHLVAFTLRQWSRKLAAMRIVFVANPPDLSFLCNHVSN